MEYRGHTFGVVQTIPKGWRWSVKRDHNDKVGTTFDRQTAIRHAQRFIDELIKLRENHSEA